MSPRLRAQPSYGRVRLGHAKGRSVDGRAPAPPRRRLASSPRRHQPVGKGMGTAPAVGGRDATHYHQPSLLGCGDFRTARSAAGMIKTARNRQGARFDLPPLTSAPLAKGAKEATSRRWGFRAAFAAASVKSSDYPTPMKPLDYGAVARSPRVGRQANLLTSNHMVQLRRTAGKISVSTPDVASIPLHRRRLRLQSVIRPCGSRLAGRQGSRRPFRSAARP